MSALDVMLDRLAGVKKQGGGYLARCPAHDDRTQSLGINVGDDDRVLVKCHAGCELDAIVAAVGLSKADLFARKKEPRDRLVAAYEYRDESGALLYVVERRDPKRFLQKKPAAGGGWTYKLNGVRRVPYRLAELLEGVAAGRWCIVVEGEKDADRLVAAGYVATCNAGGAGKWRADDWAPMFEGAKVAIVPDNDEPGRKHGEQVARSLAAVAADVRLVTLADVGDHGDVSDWLAQGHDAAELRELVKSAPAWTGIDPDPTPLSVLETEHPAIVVDDGAELLDQVAAFIGRFVAFDNPAQLTAAVLWAAHTHALDAFDVSPRFAAMSVEPGSGKTRLLEVQRLLVRRPLFVSSISEAALFRVVEATRPTLIHDEIDAVFGPKARDQEDKRALLNSGWERGAVVTRCVGEGSALTTRDFRVFAAVALAGLGKLPETIEQRAIVCRMKRRRPDQDVEKLRRRRIGPEAETLRVQLEAWLSPHIGVLAAAEPSMPDGLTDRAEDAWEPLLAVADLAGGDWPQRARTAAVGLFDARRDDEASIGVRLLDDLRRAFSTAEWYASGDLAVYLAAVEGGPWAEWSERGFTAHALAKLLRRYDIRPAQHRVGEATFRGYVRDDFEDAWTRYLPPCPTTATTVATATPGARTDTDLLQSEQLLHLRDEPQEHDDLDRFAGLDGPTVAELRAAEAVARKMTA